MDLSACSGVDVVAFPYTVNGWWAVIPPKIMGHKGEVIAAQLLVIFGAQGHDMRHAPSKDQMTTAGFLAARFA